MDDTELISSEIGYFKPRISRRREIVEAIIGALAIAAFVAVMIWFATL
jgi:choline-glycine betaine transporter